MMDVVRTMSRHLNLIWSSMWRFLVEKWETSRISYLISERERERERDREWEKERRKDAKNLKILAFSSRAICLSTLSDMMILMLFIEYWFNYFVWNHEFENRIN